MDARARLSWWRARKRQVITFLLATLLASALYFAIPAFFTTRNLINLLRQVSINGIIASGMTIVMIGGGFDLSVGAELALAGVCAVQLAKISLWLGILCPVALGGVIGIVNGFLVGRLVINPLIATLGSRYLVYAAANLLTAGFIQYNQNPAFLRLGRGSLGALPAPVIVLFCVAVLAHFILSHTTIGAALFAVGSNERAAFFSGLPCPTIQTLSYTATGICAGLAGVILASRLGVAAPDAGEGYELDAIAAVVIGGTSMNGGAGSISQTLGGVLLLGVLSNFLVLAGQPYEVQRIVTGLTIVVAVSFDYYRHRLIA